MSRYDVAILGAGAAGMMCAAVAGQRGRRVILVDHAELAGEKIRISGGGRCNFTNTQTGPSNFISDNADFCRSALARYSPLDFVKLVQAYGIGYHEKHLGQLFCDGSSQAIIDMLRAECDRGRVAWQLQSRVISVQGSPGGFVVQTSSGPIECSRVVVATGGLSIPKIGASDFGYRLARQFGMRVIATRPGLVPLRFDERLWQPYAELAGVALPGEIATRRSSKDREVRFQDDLLFTHRGLSGPAVLQISSFWREGQALGIDLAPAADLPGQLLHAKATTRLSVLNALAQSLPRRLAQQWLTRQFPDGERLAGQRVAETSDQLLRDIARSLASWQVIPTGSEGYRKAEVTCGGVDTKQLSQQSMESLVAPGLFFIGEVVDVTGWLGGYNFQWAWASAVAAARAL